MQVGFLNFPGWQKAFNKAAWERRSCFWGGVMESGEERRRQDRSKVKDKTLCCWKGRYLGGEALWATWRTGPLPYQSKQMTGLICHSLGVVLYLPIFYIASWWMGGTSPPFDFRVGQVICFGEWEVCGCDVDMGLRYTCGIGLALLCSCFLPWKGHASGKCSSKEDERHVGELETQPQVGTKPSQAQPPSLAKPLSTHRRVSKT